jgi:hypothetical protein
MNDRGDEPFPWLGVAIAAIPITLIMFALIVGAFWWR